MNLGPFAKGVQLSVRAAMGAGLSLALAPLFGLEYPIYAFLAAVIVTDLSPAQTTKLGWRRLVATVVGATCGALLAHVLPAGSATVGLGVLSAMLLCNLVRMEEGAKVGGYICGIVLFSYRSDPWVYAFYRLLETLLGVGVAWAISLVPRLIEVEEGP